MEDLLRMCETELNFLDMAINSSKSCCMRIGPRSAISCANISTRDGRTLSWVSHHHHQSELVGDVAVPVSARQAVLF